MVVKTEMMQIKERDFIEIFHLRSDKGDLRGFQTNFEIFFLQLSVVIWHMSIGERASKFVSKFKCMFWSCGSFLVSLLQWRV